MSAGQRFSEISADTAGGRLERLRQQERVWFSWVCRLHDVHSGSESTHTAAVLSIARRRWAEVRRALEREAQLATERGAERPIVQARPASD